MKEKLIHDIKPKLLNGAKFKIKILHVEKFGTWVSGPISTVDRPVNQWFLICDFLLVYCCQSVMKVLLGRIGSSYVTYYVGEEPIEIYSQQEFLQGAG